VHKINHSLNQRFIHTVVCFAALGLYAHSQLLHWAKRMEAASNREKATMNFFI